MFLELESQLAQLPDSEVERLLGEALEYLDSDDRFLDTDGCAAELCIDIGLMFEIRSTFQEKFRLLEEKFFSKLEHTLSQISLGKIEAKPQQVSTIKWILERRSGRWTPVTKIKHEKGTRESNGKAARLMEDYYSKRGKTVVSVPDCEQ